jgi:hypothetical protein
MGEIEKDVLNKGPLLDRLVAIALGYTEQNGVWTDPKTGCTTLLPKFSTKEGVAIRALRHATNRWSIEQIGSDFECYITGTDYNNIGTCYVTRDDLCLAICEAILTVKMVSE